MNVELNKHFPLEHRAETAWTLLSDIEAVALCMPGAEITEVIDQNNFKGKVKVKLGPVSMAFAGTIKVQSVDAEEQTIQLVAEGQDNKGTSSASMDLTANINAAGDAGSGESGSALDGAAKVIVNGKLASFGQRMMAQVSDQILDQFANNFRNKLSALEAAQTSDEGDVDKASPSGDNTAADMPTATTEASAAPSSTGSATSATSAAPATPAESQGNEINGFKFALQAIIGLITGLFKRK